MGPQILVLRLPRCPAAIRHLVMPTRVDSVEREVSWTGSHIGEERGEVVAPSVADRDSTRTVEPIVRRRFRVAAAFHAAPDRVFALAHAIQKAAVLDVSARAHRLLLAAARARVAADQIFSHLHRFVAAVATTQPERAFRSWRCVGTSEHRQFTESVSCNVRCDCGSHAVNCKAAAAIVPVSMSEYLS